ncbi:armadillo-type protein [Mycena sp. CBHHK59/15]|nr:armadillo-type protein [Mycena sp. CBHHK59/15]
MGLLVSILKPVTANSDESAPRPNPPTNTSGGQSPPRYIAMPPPMFNPSSLVSASPSGGIDDPLASPMWSPALEMYHTAPSTPITSPLIEVPSHSAAVQRANEPPPALHLTIPESADPVDIDMSVEEAFPTAEIPIDLFDDEGLSALEKIYLFARSESVFHRLYIVHALPSFLEQVTPQEAIGYVLPLVPGLAKDEDEKVKEALVAELVQVIWWFFTHCQVIPDDLGVEESVYPSSTSTISVQAFTPILGTLLLSPNAKVGGAARYVVVNILSRIRRLNAREPGSQVGVPAPVASTSDSDSEEDDSTENIPIGLFGPEERSMFEQELLQQVVIGMGRLDIDIEDDAELYEGQYCEEDVDESWPQHPGEGEAVEVVGVEEQADNGEDVVMSPRELEKPPEASPASENVNPYFPILPSYSVLSPGSSNSSTPSSVTDTSSSSSSPSPVSSGHPSPPVSLNPSRSSTSSLMTNAASQGSELSSTRSETTLGDRPSSRQSNTQSIARVSPQAEFPPGPSSIPSPSRSLFNLSPSVSEVGSDEMRRIDEMDMDDVEGDQASVGRLSSMSLMAAVTANGCLDEGTQHAFVKEVERVGRDPVYWVRREASYALGALAKVVPDEVVICSLMPLFDSLRRDSQWHVRHSALFALPAILSRLTPAQRRSLALDTIIPLSTDESQPVRSGALESLGEVLYTFHEDADGPPEELVQLFLGRREDKRVRDGQQAAENRAQILNSLFGRANLQQQSNASHLDSPSTSFYNDPARPLICAFNYPAVAFTLGQDRWGELREAYLEIADNREVNVRRSLAASLGELAKIIGEKNAARDLIGVWWDVVRSEEEEVRERLIDCVKAFVAALGKEARIAVVNGLLTLWEEGIFKGWRERKGIAKALTDVAQLVGRDIPDVVRGLLRKGLEDGVSAVREAAISTLPRIWSMFLDQENVLKDLREDVRKLSQSEVYRQRMTFVACLQALLVLDAPDGKSPITTEDQFWSAVVYLADDSVVGVRIGVARLVRAVYERYQKSHQRVSGFLLDLVRHLSLDSSHDVQAFVKDSIHSPRQTSDATSEVATKTQRRNPSFATFSRPPLPPSPHFSTLPPETSSYSGQDEIKWQPTISMDGDVEMGDVSFNTPVRPTSAVQHASPREERTLVPRRGSSEFLVGTSDSKRL